MRRRRSNGWAPVALGIFLLYVAGDAMRTAAVTMQARCENEACIGEVTMPRNAETISAASATRAGDPAKVILSIRYTNDRGQARDAVLEYDRILTGGLLSARSTADIVKVGVIELRNADGRVVRTVDVVSN
ncbi:hypothetical protein HY413_00640 [Candidatus Kaiserbacteria bacterium]|nr:hypothetical protein [Candidatus Kaiserbacteria bacterium]